MCRYNSGEKLMTHFHGDRVEETALSLIDAMSKYFVARAKLVTKTIKYPNVGDYKEVCTVFHLGL
jgi:hypothetical protein